MADPHVESSGAQSRFSWDDVSAVRFAEYHEENPQVYETLRRFALEAKRGGRPRLSINMLFERVRWETTVDGRGDTFKVNNSFRAHFARLLMRDEPELRGFFETRKSKADAA